MTNAGPRPSATVALASLGCPKNLVDSEVLLGRLAQAGFAVCEDFQDADIVLVNTCCFIRDSEDESLSVIREALDLKRSGGCRGVVVAGCLPQRYGPALAGRLAGVDAFVGIAERGRIAEVCRAVLEGNGRSAGRAPLLRIRPPTQPCAPDTARLRLTPRHVAYVRIAEGCDHTCAFCVIPQIRGPYRSKPPEAVRDEVRELAADGAREILLIAQDTTAYGTDRGGRRALPGLLRTLAGVDGVAWIRLLYAHPSGLTDELIEALAGIPQVVPYLDLPVQHVTDRMLRIMRRGHSKADLLSRIGRLRDRIPGLAIRTTVLVGHPGETPADVDELVAALESVRFDRLGAFAYSNEAGSRAASLPGAVPAAEAARRRDRVMRAQQAVAFAAARARVGGTVPVIVDAAPRRRGGAGTGRTTADAPDIDPVIRLTGPGLRPGRIGRARVTAARGYDLIGELLAS
jgi:ribosomal protein S12 methylthiotransferase